MVMLAGAAERADAEGQGTKKAEIVSYHPRRDITGPSGCMRKMPQNAVSRERRQRHR